MDESITNLSASLKMADIGEIDKQTIYYCNLDSNETNANTSVSVTGNDVTIVPSSGRHENGSSKVKLKNVVDYTWEHKFYPGQILAIHISGDYIAYGIQAKDIGVIRVFNMKTSERGMIKGISGMTQDVAFAFIKSPILLACIDSVGDVFVYAVQENMVKALSCCLTLHIRNDPPHPNSSINRIVWCPFVPDEDSNEDDDSSKLIVTRGNKVHLWTVNQVRVVHGLNPVTPKTAGEGFLEIIDEHDIVDVAFSPDGSTIAVACSDGGIRFFQIDVEEGNSPLCIHNWRPHNDNPVSCLYFLDNHLDADSHFWKFAVTGINGNSEIKIWSCESWSCLQTIRYTPDSSSGESKLKVCVDITANYILISDMEKRLLYVLQLRKDKDETEIRVHVVSEFLLPCPILSFGIIAAKRDYFAEDSWSSLDTSSFRKDDSRDICIEDEMDGSTSLKTMIKLYLVQPKALHECIILYDSADVTTKFNERKTNFIDHSYAVPKNTSMINGLCDKSEKHSKPEQNSRVVDLSSIMNSIKVKPNEKYLPVSVIESMHLPTPTEEHKSDSRMNNGLTRRSVNLENISCHQENVQMNGSQESDDENSTDERNEDNGNLIISTGSSPSREVQDILFASEKADENDTEQLTENTKNDPSATIWPKIPNIGSSENICPNMANMMQMNSAEQIRSRCESKKNVCHIKSLNNEIDAPPPVVLDKMASLETRMNQMQENLKFQQNEIKESLNALHQYLTAHKEEERKRRHVKSDEGLNENRIVNTITQNVNSMISNEVEYIIKQEISGNVLPSLKSTMDNVGQQLHLKMSSHFSSAEQQLRDHIIKTVHKKSVTDSFANAVGSVVPSIVSEAFADVFCNAILPKFEKSCQEMFSQVNNLFVDGTREFLNLMTNHIRSYEEKQTALLQAKIDEIMSQVREAAEVSSINAIKNLQPELLKSLRHDLEEHRLQLESCIMNTSKASPTSFLHHAQKQQAQQEQIEYLIAQGKIDVAIEQALSASDLKLLVRLCEKLDPDKVFAEPCVIQQHILLSFIQQLSVDLNIQTDLKHRFIEGAVMCLDKKHPICEKNFPKILPPVRSRILQYIGANPNNKNTRNMKILLMAVESLLGDKNDQRQA